MTLEITQAVCQIFCVFGLGWLARHLGYLQARDLGRLSRLAIDFLMPCLVFSATTKHFAAERISELWPLPVIALAIVVFGALIGGLVRFGLGAASLSRRRTVQHLCAVNNAIFLPVIIVQALWGQSAVANLFFFSLGASLGMWSIGVAILGGGSLRHLGRHLLTSTHLALLAALVLCLSGLNQAIPELIAKTTDFVGASAIPIILFLVGANLYPLPRLRPRALVLLCSTLRVLVIPILLTLILRLLPLVPEVYNQAVVNAFMPSAAISTILTYRFGGDPQLAASTVFATTLASLITVPLGLTWALG